MSEKIIVEKAKITALAEAVRTNTGSTDKLTLDEIAEIVEGLKDYSAFLLSDTLEEYNNDILTSLKEYAFYKNTKLASVSLPKVTEVPAYAFAYTGLTDFNFSNVSKIDDYAFLNSELTGTVTVKDGYGNYIFNGTKIKQLIFNNASSGFYAEKQLQDCAAIKTVKLRTGMYFSNYNALQNCTNLKKVWISKEAVAKSYYGSTGKGLFFGAPTDLEYYVEADAMTGYGWKDSTEWTLLATDTYATVHYGITEEEFDKL